MYHDSVEWLSFSFFFIILKSCKEFHNLQLIYLFINDPEQNPWRHFDRTKMADITENIAVYLFLYNRVH